MVYLKSVLAFMPMEVSINLTACHGFLSCLFNWYRTLLNVRSKIFTLSHVHFLDIRMTTKYVIKAGPNKGIKLLNNEQYLQLSGLI